MKRFVLASLTTVLASCEVAPPKPSVRSVTPGEGATHVARNTTVQAQLELSDGEIDLVTLNEVSVALTGPAGAVAAERTLSDSVITLEPTEDLAPDTSYTFSVTSDLQLGSGARFTPFSSSFTTGTAGVTPPLSLVMRNDMGLPSENRMVLFKIGRVPENACFEQPEGCNPDRWQNIAFYESGTLTLENTGDAPLTVSLVSEPLALFSVNPSTVTVEASETEEVTVTFIGTELGDKGIYPATLRATASEQSASFELVGVFQPRPEGSAELSIGRLIEAFGYGTDLGDTSSGSIPRDEVDSPKAGAEVRSHYWRASRAGSPVVVSQLAAFLPCCGGSQQTFDFELFTQSGSKIARLPFDTNYSQSIFPPSPNGKFPNTLAVKTGANFRFDIFGYSSIPGNGYLGIRFWPLVDGSGVKVADTYIVAQDFARGPCGSSGGTTDGAATGSNCDYNDALYLVENIEPVSPY